MYACPACSFVAFSVGAIDLCAWASDDSVVVHRSRTVNHSSRGVCAGILLAVVEILAE